MTCSKCWLVLGAILAGLAVAAGAFGAHGLDSHFHKKYAFDEYKKEIPIYGHDKIVSRMPLAEKYLADFKTGAQYQMYHGLALLAVGILARLRPSRGLTAAGWCFLLGCVGFSGGLYAYTLTGATWFGMTIVPLGGVLFLAGWATLAISLWREPKIVSVIM
ncbi:MAG: DUF423 domain-containing protein [Planctomycetia bacterium]|nr:DUF423 domain-containing protein [Planctomycetia bacterium]